MLVDISALRFTEAKKAEVSQTVIEADQKDDQPKK